MLTYKALVAPQEDGGILVDPSASDLPSLIHANRRILDAARVTLAGRPLAEVRAETRRALLGDADQPAWVIGHQPDFIHAGVWFKHVVADRLARLTGGVAVNLTVDSDVPKSTSLRAVRLEGEEPVMTEVAVPTAVPRRPYEQWAAMDASELRAFGEAVREAMGSSFERSLMPAILRAYGAVGAGEGFVAQAVGGRRVADALIGATLIDHPVSACWGGPLLGRMLADAPRFAGAYNAALGAYRREQRIKGAHRPIPDLHADGERIELPLWAWRPDEPRRRLFVGRRGDRFAFYGDERLLGDAGARDVERWCHGSVSPLPGTTYVVRPRALALTLWARLLVADVFVHGIGGAKYDRVTDRLIRDYFGIEPPAMACASATLRLPLGVKACGDVGVREAERKLRDWTYNPQRLLPDSGAWRPLFDERAAVLERGRRLRLKERGNHAARREVFEAARRLNERMRATAPRIEADLRQALEHARQQVPRARVAASRDLFVGLFPPAKLEELATRFDDQLGC